MRLVSGLGHPTAGTEATGILRSFFAFYIVFLHGASSKEAPGEPRSQVTAYMSQPQELYCDGERKGRKKRLSHVCVWCALPTL